MKRSELKNILENADLSAREREMIYLQEFEKTVTVKELCDQFNVEERQVMRIKQKALYKIGQYLGII